MGCQRRAKSKSRVILYSSLNNDFVFGSVRSRTQPNPKKTKGDDCYEEDWRASRLEKKDLRGSFVRIFHRYPHRAILAFAFRLPGRGPVPGGGRAGPTGQPELAQHA